MAALFLSGDRGYLGSCVAARLARAGIPFTTRPERLQALLPRSLDASAVIHCAGNLRHRGDDTLHESHVQGTWALLDALKRPVPVVFVSSRSVYGRHDGAVLDETCVAQPADVYGEAKLQAEETIRTSGCPYVILRLSTLIGYGVGGDGHSFLRNALHRLQAGQDVTRFTPDRPHDALDIWAAADACVSAARGSAWNTIFNVAGPIRSLHATVAAMADACGAGHLIRDVPSDPAGWGVLASDRFATQFPEWKVGSDATLFREWIKRLAASGRYGDDGRQAGGE